METKRTFSVLGKMAIHLPPALHTQPKVAKFDTKISTQASCFSSQRFLQKTKEKKIVMDMQILDLR